jgi:hypothetical protein
MEGKIDSGGAAEAGPPPHAVVLATVVADGAPSDSVSARLASRKPPAYGLMGLRTDRTLPVSRPDQSP